MKKTLNTLALGLCLVAITACSSARGESESTTSLDAADTAAAEECAGKDAAECAGDDIGCCAEKAEEQAKDACCEEGDAIEQSDS